MAAVAVTLLGMSVGTASVASAVGALDARATGVGSAGTGQWGAVATTASAPPYGSGALVLSYLKNGTKAPPPQYFWLVSTGTLPLVAVTTTATSTVSGKLETCTGAWNEGTGVCTGTVGTLDTTSTGATSTAVSIAAASRIRVKASLTAGLSGTTTLTISVSVPRSGTRSGRTTSS